MNRRVLKSIGWLTLSTVLLIIDEITKYWADSVLRLTGPQGLIPGILGLKYAQNTGAAFSAFSGATIGLSLVSLAVCAGIVIFIIRKPMWWPVALSLSVILAGGAGNLIDRLFRGYVVDFFEVLFIRFAIFNVADVYITTGAAFLIILLLFGGEKVGRMAD